MNNIKSHIDNLVGRMFNVQMNSPVPMSQGEKNAFFFQKPLNIPNKEQHNPQVDNYQNAVQKQIGSFAPNAVEPEHRPMKVVSMLSQMKNNIIPQVQAQGIGLKIPTKGQPTPSAIPVRSNSNISLNPDVKQFLDSVALPITRKYGIPDAVAAGQFAGEGRLGGFGAKRNNFFNIAAYDSNPNAAFHYETPEAGVEAYAKLISGQYRLANGQLDQRYLPAFDLRNNPEEMLKMIHQLGYASRPDYASFISQTPEFQYYLGQ